MLACFLGFLFVQQHENKDFQWLMKDNRIITKNCVKIPRPFNSGGRAAVEGRPPLVNDKFHLCPGVPH